MKSNKFLIHTFFLLGVIIIQAYFPIIHVGSITMSPDITLVYISIMAILFGRFSIIFLAFLLGLAQDLISQVTLIGLFSFIKSLSVYLIGSINLHESMWNRKIKYSVLIATYFIHFFIYFYVVINDNSSWYVILQYSILQSIFTFGIFWILNSFIFRRRFI
jgi:cell shape-determining protein MreD|tara:strand:+ start:1243 stop:1725 length:483 start_codon:yes stop_codon:yes gene_type:complete